MTEKTPLDISCELMKASQEDDAARLRFFESVAETELFVLLEKEHSGEEKISPLILPVEEQQYILVFDREERLAQFAQDSQSAYAAMSGRVLVELIAGASLGIGINLGVEASEMLLPASAIEWLKTTLEADPIESKGQISEVFAPHGLPEIFITSLDRKLALTQGLADFVYLVGVQYEGGVRSHLLTFINHVPGSEDALARLVSEALIFSGVEAGALDVAFFKQSDSICASFARFGLRFDLPVKSEASAAPKAPGMDPNKPPVLK